MGLRLQRLVCVLLELIQTGSLSNLNFHIFPFLVEILNELSNESGMS